MKIIQIVAAVNGENPGSVESQLLGLGDDGCLYEFEMARQAAVMSMDYCYLHNDEPAKALAEGKQLRFRDGNTVGWKLICMSMDRPKPLPHPLDPTLAERS